MNKKGFTLVELLAVIAILAIVMTIGVYSFMGISSGIKQKMLDTKIKNLETAAIEYGQENKSELTGTCEGTGYDSCLEITVGKLVDEEYFETEETEKDAEGKTIKTVINNVTNKSMMNDKIQIYRKNNRVYALYLDKTDK